MKQAIAVAIGGMLVLFAFPTAHAQEPTTGDDPCDSAEILIVMDRSGSMDDRKRGVRPIKEARQSIVMVADMMEHQDQLGLVVFNDSAGVTVPLSPGNAQEVAEKARVMRAKGGTSFNAGLRKAAQTIQDSGKQWVQLVFISDGDDPSRISDRYIDALRGMNVHVNTIAAGRDANQAKLCGLASHFGGWCAAVHHGSLKPTLAHMVQQAQCQRTITNIRDVIRTGETHKFQIEMMQNQGSIQLTGTWLDGELSFLATSPSGEQYSTEDAEQAIDDTYRILRPKARRGTWVFQVTAKEVPAEGEAYRVIISTENDGGVNLVPLSEFHRPESPVDISLAECTEGTKGILYEKGEASQILDFIPGPNETCTATFQTPGVVGFFPVSIQTKGKKVLWTSLNVGNNQAIISSRDQWRPKEQPWAKAVNGLSHFVLSVAEKLSGTSSCAMTFLFLLLLALAALFVSRQYAGSPSKETGTPSKKVEKSRKDDSSNV